MWYQVRIERANVEERVCEPAALHSCGAGRQQRRTAGPQLPRPLYASQGTPRRCDKAMEDAAEASQTHSVQECFIAMLTDGVCCHRLHPLLTLPPVHPSALPQSVKYNIPVAIWLPERYPLAGPLAYVVPTPDMVIKPRHTFVDASGACMLGPAACFALEAWHARNFQTCIAGASILAWRCGQHLQTWPAASPSLWVQHQCHVLLDAS